MLFNAIAIIVNTLGWGISIIIFDRPKEWRSTQEIIIDIVMVFLCSIVCAIASYLGYINFEIGILKNTLFSYLTTAVFAHPLFLIILDITNKETIKYNSSLDGATTPFHWFNILLYIIFLFFMWIMICVLCGIAEMPNIASMKIGFYFFAFIITCLMFFVLYDKVFGGIGAYAQAIGFVTPLILSIVLAIYNKTQLT